MKYLSSVLFSVGLLISPAVANSLDIEITDKHKKIFKQLIDDDVETFLRGGGALLSRIYPLINIKPEKLISDYAENEFKANRTYKGKQIAINGKIDAIQADISDKPVVTFRGGKNSFNRVHAKFQESEYDAVADLKKGNTVTLYCVGGSEVAGSPILNDCLFKESYRKHLEKVLENKFEKVYKGDFDNDIEFAEKTLSFYLRIEVSGALEKCKNLDLDCVIEQFDKVKPEDIEDAKEKFPKIFEWIEENKPKEETEQK